MELAVCEVQVVWTDSEQAIMSITCESTTCVVLCNVSALSQRSRTIVQKLLLIFAMLRDMIEYLYWYLIIYYLRGVSGSRGVVRPMKKLLLLRQDFIRRFPCERKEDEPSEWVGVRLGERVFEWVSECSGESVRGIVWVGQCSGGWVFE